MSRSGRRRRPLLVLLVALALSGCGDDELQGDLLLRADRLFDGERMIEPGALLVRGDAIVAVGEELEADAARTIDLGDATILPGFIDLHVHTNVPSHLRGGVTTVRNLGAPIETLRPAGRYGGLRVLGAGPIVTAKGGYPLAVRLDDDPRGALEVEGAEQARADVRDARRPPRGRDQDRDRAR